MRLAFLLGLTVAAALGLWWLLDVHEPEGHGGDALDPVAAAPPVLAEGQARATRA
ncbi:MAG: hypothetical protein P1V36_04740 [Planctomycetota bacterium]|nr:hypothetical protein [Planctomycetota bacterium]